jgi:predicted DNA-binding WGR domain protein
VPDFRSYLELSEEGGGSHKFYEVVIEGTTLTIRYGRIGDKGQSQVKAFPSFEKAKAEADKKIREKASKGYAAAVLGERKKRTVTRREVVSRPSTSRAAPVLWQFDSGSAAFGVFVDAGLCWVGNQKGNVYALDHAGKVVCNYQLPDGVKCLVADGEWLYAGCDDGNVYDLTSKAPRVAYRISESVDILWIDIKDGVLGVGDTGAQISVFNHEEETCWTQKQQGGYGWMVRCDEIGVYFGCGARVTMYDWQDGRVVWEHALGGGVLFGWQEESAVYAACGDNLIYKVSKRGERLATYRCDAGVFSCATAPDGAFVFAGDNSSSIYCFDAEGKRLWKVGTGAGSALSMQFFGDRLFIVTSGGALCCLDVRAEAIAAAEQGTVPVMLKIAAPTAPAVQVSTTVETTATAGSGVVVECVEVGSQLRVRPVGAGFHADWFVQFPKDLRVVGARYVVAELRESSRGGFYRAFGEIKKLG